MPSPFKFRQMRRDEYADVARRTQLVLGATEDFDSVVERVAERASLGLIWVLADAVNDSVLGQIVLSTADHCFGGRRVPCQQVIDLLVLPEHRSKGVGAALMHAATRRGVSEGLGLSLLLPSTTSFYRKVGWEHSGTFTRWRVITRFVPPIGPSMRLLDDEWEAVEACHERWALCFNGPEVRSALAWKKIRASTQFAYGLTGGDEGGLDAYVLVEHKGIADHYQYVLRLTDWAAPTPRGMQAVVGFVGRNGTMARDVVFRAPAPNPWGPLLPEQDLERIFEINWMARPLDLPAAISARGFPEGLGIEATLAVNDAVAESNQGPWRLMVADGRGRLEPTEEADVRLEVTALGPLFTGYRSASELARAGLLAGPMGAVARLDAAFAGPPPVLFDFF